jgi:hypothetical protein
MVVSNGTQSGTKKVIIRLNFIDFDGSLGGTSVFNAMDNITSLSGSYTDVIGNVVGENSIDDPDYTWSNPATGDMSISVPVAQNPDGTAV